MVPRLIALLVCNRVETDDGGTKNLYGVHNAVLVSGGPVGFVLFAEYVGVTGPHEVAVGIEGPDGNMQRTPPQTVVADDAFEVTSSTIDFPPVPALPGDYAIHLLIDGAGIGSTPYFVRPLDPPS
jgi:hypothetical protein